VLERRLRDAVAPIFDLQHECLGVAPQPDASGLAPRVPLEMLGQLDVRISVIDCSASAMLSARASRSVSLKWLAVRPSRARCIFRAARSWAVVSCSICAMRRRSSSCVCINRPASARSSSAAGGGCTRSPRVRRYS
jgi:hypothetical protein